MTDADDLAQRYLVLWTQYLTGLLADPRTLDMLRRWIALTGRFSYPPTEGAPAGEASFPAWPPLFTPFGMPSPAMGTPDASAQIAALADRVADIERRLAELERQPAKRLKKADPARTSTPKSR